ncbi:uncharacterized protein [Asterias amurensis]|uniref:uncharacterized protein n=1 Tax=Asterias amurensis TaxID=7602 RepID=UPI003AB4B404
MGLWSSKLTSALSELAYGPGSHILMLGLDDAGKTTILYKLKLNMSSIPTIGFNVETVSPMPGLTFTVWDVGGQQKVRQMWRDLSYQGTQGLIYVVDSSDKARLSESRDELFGILNNPELPSTVPVVVLANKQDLPSSLGPSDIAQALKLHHLSGHPWHIQGTCAPNGEGIYEAVSVLGKMVQEYMYANWRYNPNEKSLIQHLHEFERQVMECTDTEIKGWYK